MGTLGKDAERADLIALLEGRFSNSRPAAIGLAGSVATAFVVLGVSLWAWNGIRQFSKEFLQVMSSPPKSQVGVDFADYMLESNNHLLMMAMAAALGIVAVSVLLALDLRHKRRLRSALAYLQSPDGANALAAYSREVGRP